MDPEERYKKFNDILIGISLDELHDKSREEYKRNEEDFQQLKAALAQGKCSFCGDQITYFSYVKPCFHWLLKPKGFKKKHFPLLFKGKGFHQIESYLRWVANCDKPLTNINDLVEEKSSSKFIEETIRYKNIEWSFSCSYGDRMGHKERHEGQMPHYHFQMQVDGNVIINYNGFHIPFNDYDEFSFAVKDGKFDRLKAKHIHGAGMQTVLSDIGAEKLVDNMKRANDEGDAQLDVQIMIEANEGTTISGDEIADLIEESKRTGVSMAKLIQKLKNIKAQTIISPGPGVPKIASRKKNRGKN